MPALITIPESEGEVTYELANFGQRFAARLIDSLIIFIPNSFIPLIPGWLYWSLQQSSSEQATIGQKTLGIKVVSTYGNKMHFGQATGRFFGNFLNILTLLIGYFLFFTNEKKQCLHDMVSGTVVVKAIPVENKFDITWHMVD